MSDLTFNSSVTRTGGAYVNVIGSNTTLERLHANGAAIGFVFGAGALNKGDDLSCRNVVAASVFAASTCILGTGASEATVLNNPQNDVDSATVNNMPRSCLNLSSTDAWQINNANLIHCQSIVLANPPSGQAVLSTQLTGGFLDTPLAPGASIAYALELDGSAGAIARFSANGTWFGDACHLVACTGDGIALKAGAPVTQGFYCANCMLILNQRYGISVPQSWTDVRFIGGLITANGTADVNLATNASNVSFVDVSHNQAGATTSPAGFIINAGTVAATVADNDFTGVATPISFPGGVGALGAKNRLENNPGYNPVGGSTVVVGASPFTHCAGPTGETVFTIANSTITGVQVGSLSTAQTYASGLSFTTPLGLNECMTLTFSGTIPAMTRYVH
jgi:hypothetical protein